jgi:hypothetical protein
MRPPILTRSLILTTALALTAALILTAALPAYPEAVPSPMTADEFDAYVTGKTLTYSQYSSVFGVEEYLPDRKVRWSVAPDLCQYGSWYPEADKICFVYEYDPDPHCWTFWLGPAGLTALSAEDLPGAELSEVQQSDVPLQCPGPDVGV